MKDLTTYIADAVQESGRKSCSGEVLVIDRLHLEAAIDAGFKKFNDEYKNEKIKVQS